MAVFNRITKKADKRYTVSLEYHDKPHGVPVARFKGEWLGDAPTIREAWELAQSHYDNAQKDELGFSDMSVRFFRWDEEAMDGEIPGDFVECTEEEWLDAPGAIEYVRHTVHANGVKQICLTKNPLDCYQGEIKDNG